MGKTLQQSESWKGTAQPGQLDGQICKACLADRRGGPGRSVLQPAHGLLALVEIEFAHLRQHQRIKHAVGEGAQRAVGHQGDLADLVVHGIDELQVCKQGADALPTGELPTVDPNGKGFSTTAAVGVNGFPDKTTVEINPSSLKTGNYTVFIWRG